MENNSGDYIILKKKATGEIIKIPLYWYEVKDAYIVELACFYKEDYEQVNNE